MATASLSASSLHAVLGDSLRLRDEALAVLLAQWTGPVKRASEPDDLGRLVLDLSTASLFEEPALWVVRAGLPYLRKHRETLLGLAGQPVAAGAMVLVCPPPERNDALGPLLKALAKAGAVHDVEPPDARQLVDWLAHRLLLPGAPAVERPRQLAESLVAGLGDDCDGLLGAIETLATYCGGSPITPEAVAELCGGTAA
ncbi:MAG: hypothetical protein H0W72_14015, partial [Planctomycetes bacterium]|nr:hypothetical protein [Planctomycetota bacterium]